MDGLIPTSSLHPLRGHDNDLYLLFCIILANHEGGLSAKG